MRIGILLVAMTAVAIACPAAAAPAHHVDPVTVAVGRYPTVVTVDHRRHTVYVANAGNGQAVNGNGSVSIIRGSGVRTLRVGGTPVDVAVDASRHTAYVPVYNAESSLLVLAPHQRSRLPLSNPQAVAVDQTNHTVWVLEAPRILVRIDEDGTQASYAVKGAFPNRLAVNSQTHIPYVLSTDGTLSWVASSGKVLVQQLGDAAQALAVDSTNGTVYVAHSSYFANGVSHPALLSVLSGLSLRLVDLGSFGSVGGLDIDESTGTAAIALYTIGNRAYGDLALVRNLHAKHVTVGGTPDAVAIDRGTGTVCVADQWSNSVSVVQAGVATSTPVGDYPIAATADDGLCFVANFRSNTVSEIPLP